MTQILMAKKGIITEEMKKVALKESVDPEFIREGVAKGTIVILKNNRHTNIEPVGVGEGLFTKVNANIGTSSDLVDTDGELRKLRAAITAGADTVMDLSTGGDLDEVRQLILKESSVPVGTVPIYQVAVEYTRKNRKIEEIEIEDIFRVIEKHAGDGVDFMTIHCGLTSEGLRRLRKEGRILDIVSRGGSILARWMEKRGKENPLFEYYDTLLDIAFKYDVVLSLGDGLRPGCISDATDRAQIQELLTLGELAERAWEKGVQVMIEGPGHVPMDQIEANVKLEKRICHGAPFYVLGPLVTDIAPGYDHIVGAIGGAIAAAAGADLLCYVTPSEHLRLPDLQDVWEGVMASKIAGHAADLVKRRMHVIRRDDQMARYRKRLDWEGQFRVAIDPGKARRLRESCRPTDDEVCTMCADLCAIKAQKDIGSGK